MKRLPKAVVTVIAIGILGFWYWKHLDGLSDLGGFDRARQEARERRDRNREDEAAQPAVAAPDLEREAVTSDAGEVIASGSWWEDPDTLARFLAEFERQLPGAINLAASMRAEHAERAIRDRAELELAVAAFSERGVASAILDEHEIQGLSYDAMGPCTSVLRSKLLECMAWMDKGAKLEKLPKLSILRRNPEDQPVEFLLSRMANRSVAKLDPQTAQDVARLRNDFVREFAILGGKIWETRPAAYFAMKELGLPNGLESGQARPPILEFIPELASFAAQQDALRERYLAQLEIYAAQLK